MAAATGTAGTTTGAGIRGARAGHPLQTGRRCRPCIDQPHRCIFIRATTVFDSCIFWFTMCCALISVAVGQAATTCLLSLAILPFCLCEAPVPGPMPEAPQGPLPVGPVDHRNRNSQKRARHEEPVKGSSLSPA